MTISSEREKRYLMETDEARAWVARRRLEASSPLLLRVVLACLSGYLSELRHMLKAPAEYRK